ncbi:MAG: helicase C-terminal domain-containing protein [Spirochaetia bacterium]|jgi:ATP-dependent DNA helicase DinG|nr:helicase C-terminal domain-containing protein [Spirochaetia bacterium]
MRSNERITELTLEIIRKSIIEADGNEVMFCGRLDAKGKIESVIIAARGNEEAVPAIESFIEKGEVVIHNHPDGVLKPSNADLRIASILGAQGIGFVIIDNSAENIYVVAEPVVSKKRKKIRTDKLADKISPDGILSKIFDFYEPRDSQIEMLVSVAECFNNENMLIAEAGTGVGKSIAYLLPAFQQVINNDERVVISTNTINLQHQLLEKDIPLAKSILKTDKKAALVKGRSNYLCLRKYYEYINENSLFSEGEDKGIALIREWAAVTETGDKADLPAVPDYSIWNDICSESDYCLGLYCQHREKCFVIKARKNAATASILVVNHHLLFSDLAARSSGAGFNGTAVLPVFKHAIFDEAHNMEAAATSYFSMILSKGYLLKTFKKIYSRYRGKVSGLYLFLEINTTLHQNKVAELPKLISDTLALYDLLESEADKKLTDRQNIKIEKSLFFDDIYSALLAFKKNLLKIYNLLDDISEELDISPDDDSRIYELALVKGKIKGLISTSEIILDADDDYVSWIEKNKNISFTLTPLDVSKVLKETVYDKINTIVFTSATLSIRQSFDFWKKRIGLYSHNREITEKIFNSPFNYKKQVLFAVPTDIKDPSDPLYTSELSSFALNIIKISEGGALVLFTSYSMLMDVYNKIKEDVINNGITILRQGEFDRFRIQKIFNEDKKSVLLATDSFWEGIDSPGETLKIVIICRLPFKVPSDPVIQSRLEKIKNEGGNPFSDYSLPEAVIRLRQGFGRLMRRKTDTGIVIVTDNRIVKKSYGQVFITSLPETAKYFGEIRQIEEKVESFFYS